MQTLYLVKWLGWDREEDLTWEPLEHLQDPDGTCQALEIFEKKEKEKERLEKEKAEREEKEGTASTGDFFIIMNSFKIKEIIMKCNIAKDKFQ